MIEESFLANYNQWFAVIKPQSRRAHRERADGDDYCSEANFIIKTSACEPAKSFLCILGGFVPLWFSFFCKNEGKHHPPAGQASGQLNPAGECYSMNG